MCVYVYTHVQCICIYTYVSTHIYIYIYIYLAAAAAFTAKTTAGGELLRGDLTIIISEDEPLCCLFKKTRKNKRITLPEG